MNKYTLAILLTLVFTACSTDPQILIEEEAVWNMHIIDSGSVGADGVQLIDVNNDGLPDVVSAWEEGGCVRVSLNPGAENARNAWASETVGETPDIESAFASDLDGDGDMDIVASCEGDTKTMFVLWKDNESWTKQSIPASNNIMPWMMAIRVKIEGNQYPHIVAGGRGDGASVGYFSLSDNPRDIATWQWHHLSDAGWIMGIDASDIDGDGDVDILITDRVGPDRSLRWLENPNKEGESWANHFIASGIFNPFFFARGDLDHDGDEDIVFTANEGNKSLLLICSRLDNSGDRWNVERLLFPDGVGTAKGVALGDINNDGNPDIILTCEHAREGKSGVFWVDGKTRNAYLISGPVGIKYDNVVLFDLDADGDLDIITTEENEGGPGTGLGVVWYENPGRNN